MRAGDLSCNYSRQESQLQDTQLVLSSKTRLGEGVIRDDVTIEWGL